MRLPIPLQYGKSKFTDVELIKPSGETIADTEKIIRQGNIYSAILRFITGSIESLIGEKTVDNQNEIRTICRNLKYKSAEYIYIQSLLSIFNGEDYVEGVYQCPRCNERVIAEKTVDMDTRDKISNLEINYLEEDDYFEIELTDGLQIKSKEEILFDIKTIGFRHPTIDDYIQAYAKHTDRDRIRTQYEVFSKCIETVNGNVVDSSFKGTWGVYIFDKYRNIADINNITKEFSKYGYQTKVEKRCMQCGKEWKETLNTSNFFASALLFLEE